MSSLITSRNVPFFLIFCMVSGFLVQMQIFPQLDLTELPGLLTCLRLLNLQHLIYQRVLTGFGTLFFFSKSGLMDFRPAFWPYFVFFGNSKVRVVLYLNSLQEYPVNADVFQISILILGFTPILSCTTNLLDYSICNSTIMVMMMMIMMMLVYISVIRFLIDGNN